MLRNQLKIKFLARSHTILGLFVVFLFYISTYFGSITLFLPYLKAWELPSRHYFVQENHELPTTTQLNKLIQDNRLNHANIEIELPSFKDNTLKISTPNQNSIYLNPNTKEVLDTTYEYPMITELFNEFHTGENIPIIGILSMGVSSVILIFLMLSGIYLYVLKKITFKDTLKQNRNFRFKWHKNFGFMLTPYVIIFALTGAFLGVMLSNSAPIALSSTHFEKSNMSTLVRPILFSNKTHLKLSQTKTNPKQLKELLAIAKKHYPQLHINKINIYNYKLDNSQTLFSGYLKNEKARTLSRINPMTVLLDSNNGSIIEKKELKDSHIMKKTLSAFYWLHFQTDETHFVRIFFFIFGIVMLVCLFFGYLLWAEKKLSKDPLYLAILNRFSLAIMLGIIPSSAFMIIMYWLIPVYTFDKIVWVEGSFYVAWSFYLFYCFKEECINIILKMIFFSSSILLFLCAFLHEITTDIILFELYMLKLYPQFFIDISFLLLSCFFYVLYKKVDGFSYYKKFEQKEIG